jgi:hypothetical protein
MALALPTAHDADAANLDPGGAAASGGRTMDHQPVTPRPDFIISAVLIAVLALAAGGVMVFAQH